ncbi:up-regulator of cell proliferation-like isoform X1 [Labrus mixtus]|uniref:up-regulator of cell proliferation-like isoform X1 n=2 Tax=Labrus mixtus TaxID=508554 RepID=UPI0029C0DB74|nr:up-regulator of cell proliferation-like isoform X1 [Labrus mixtus]
MVFDVSSRFESTGRLKESVTMSFPNKEDPTVLLNFLSQLGLETFYPNKLTLRSLLEINRNSVYDEAVSSVEDIPWCFLRKLFKINAKCRNCTQLSNKDDEEEENTDVFDFNTAEDSADNKVNLLDLIVALFLCSDSFLQQEMVLKMSMCQFSVPLVLPHGNNNQCTLMVWALRDIVKEWRPHELSSSKGFVEDNIVQTELPFFSFVRLKNCSLSKSQCLNHILSLDQYNNNMFIHRDMKGGDHERKISNGLVEVCWYLPCGRENLDTFPKPIAVANLRGDIGQSITQFSFLFQVSTATFVFLDKVEENEHKILTSLQDVRSKLFLVVNRKAEKDMMTVKNTVKELELPQSSVKIKDPHVNLITFSEKLSITIKKSMTKTMKIESMLDKAVDLGLSEDECTSEHQKKVAEEIAKGIGLRPISEYKNKTLPLQGVNWKKLSQLEMEECRLKNAGDLRLEEYKSELQKEKQEIIKELGKQKLSKAMNSFIEQSSEQDKVKRDFFLKWMKLKLNAHLQPAMKLSLLRHKLTDECNKKEKDGKVIAELDQALLESSLGIEHYMREMGLIYEFSSQSQHTDDKISRLPGLAAEMLLDGYPLELLDGDASNIPQRWVTDVLMELHNKVGEKSRLLVLTVLGVQSTGKSTLLNTMFGVQFPVSSGRCTRGAYMLFLRVGDDMQSELNYDFIVLIDTEGLRSPCLAQLEDSCEHDNQLATFVIGLSDVTIINVAMENSTEMKDFLQIATHAFLRMKQIGKKPVCHFVHQNVGGVSAHAKNTTERKHLLDQLNEMTNIAAEMEKHPIIPFTDVLDYDLEKNNWNIPGLWHGTPPMAPVNTGYSEAVADFKRNLLETVKRDKSEHVPQIPEFLEWITSLWRAVKFENFIFSFRNTLVAHVYDNLCKEFNQWEWEFRKEVSRWKTETEMEIQNTENESELHHLNEMVKSKKSEVSDKIKEQKQKMDQKLQEYFKRKGRQVNLIMKYKTDFIIRIEGLTNEIQHSANNDLDCALECKKSSKEAEDLQRNHREVIEEQVMKLLSDCKKRTLSDEELEEEFEKVWAAVTVNISGLKEQDISARVLDQLRKHFVNLNVNEELQNIGDLKEFGKDPFKAKTDHIKMTKTQFVNFFFKKEIKRDLQSRADSVIASCKRFVEDTAKTDRDYHDSFTKDLLDKVNESLKQNCKKCKPKFAIDLKLHLCGFASREFLHMHRKYLAHRDPRNKLDAKKKQYLTDFIDLYKEKDHCHRKGTDYVRFCIKPAVEEYISRSLGVNIVEEILTSCHSPEYSSRSFFQYNIQKELLQKNDFESFVKYIRRYEIFVKDWIFQHVLQKMSEGQTLCKLKIKSLQVIVDKITKALKQSTKHSDGTPLPDNQESIQELINNMRTCLNKDISISVEDEKTILFQIQSTCHQFTDSLFKSLHDLKEELQEEIPNSGDISETLEKLPTKPQDELFKQVFGCGKQCPFCKVPCEAGGKEHKEHHAAVHRPQGLGMYRNIKTQELVETLCTTDVHSEKTFRSADTEGKFHPYKDYATYYPEWHIPPDRTIQASDYWKYVLVKYNDRFAEEYKSKPAVVPESWRSITKEQALKGLKEAFNIK